MIKNEIGAGAIYPKSMKCYFYEEAATKLKEAVKVAKGKNYKFKICDAFRPFEMQEKLWKAKPDANYVAFPYDDYDKLKLAHCRGVAVDITLIYPNTDEELDMGTPVDCCDVKSHPDYNGNDISDEAKENRKLLNFIMREAGFEGVTSEWWYYQLSNLHQYAIYNIKHQVLTREFLEKKKEKYEAGQ